MPKFTVQIEVHKTIEVVVEAANFFDAKDRAVSPDDYIDGFEYNVTKVTDHRKNSMEF